MLFHLFQDTHLSTFKPLDFEMNWNSFNLFSFACHTFVIDRTVGASLPSLGRVRCAGHRGKSCLSKYGLVLSRAKGLGSAPADMRSNIHLYCFYGSNFIDILFELVVRLGFRAD